MVLSRSTPNGSLPSTPKMIGVAGNGKALVGHSTKLANLSRYPALILYSTEFASAAGADGPRPIAPRRTTARTRPAAPCPIEGLYRGFSTEQGRQVKSAR